MKLRRNIKSRIQPIWQFKMALRSGHLKLPDKPKAKASSSETKPKEWRACLMGFDELAIQIIRIRPGDREEMSEEQLARLVTKRKSKEML